MNKEKKNAPEELSGKKKYVKLASSIIVVVLFFLYVFFNFKSIF